MKDLEEPGTDGSTLLGKQKKESRGLDEAVSKRKER